MSGPRFHAARRTAATPDRVWALLALLAVVLARKGSDATVPVAWVVVVVGLLDFVNIARIVAETDLISYDIGASCGDVINICGAPGVRAAAKRRRWPPTMACSNCMFGWSGISKS